MTRFILTAIIFVNLFFSVNYENAFIKAGKVYAATEHSKTIKVAVSPWYYPILFEDKARKSPAGLEVEVAESIAKRLGLKVHYVVMARDQIGAAVAAGKADIGMGAIESRSYLRGDAIVFVDPKAVKLIDYYNVPTVFVMRESGIKKIEDFKQKKVATFSFSAARESLAAWKEKKLVATVFGFETEKVLVKTLKQGRVSGILVTMPLAHELVAASKGKWHKFTLSDSALAIKEPLAIVIPTASTERSKAIEAAIEAFRASKEIDTMAKRFNLSP